MKKLIAILIASAIAFCVFAACGAEMPAATGKPIPKPMEQTAAPADSEIINLKWITVGDGMPENYDAWKAAMDAYLEEKIGVHLDMEVISWGDWEQRRNIIFSNNEPYDIIFGNNATFCNDVNRNAFADLSELLNTVPALRDFIPPAYWEACKVNGGLYAVPTYKDSSATFFFVYD